MWLIYEKSLTPMSVMCSRDNKKDRNISGANGLEFDLHKEKAGQELNVWCTVAFRGRWMSMKENKRQLPVSPEDLEQKNNWWEKDKKREGAIKKRPKKKKKHTERIEGTRPRETQREAVKRSCVFSLWCSSAVIPFFYCCSHDKKKEKVCVWEWYAWVYQFSVYVCVCVHAQWSCPQLRDFDHIGQLLLSGQRGEMPAMCLCVSAGSFPDICHCSLFCLLWSNQPATPPT